MDGGLRVLRRLALVKSGGPRRRGHLASKPCCPLKPGLPESGRYPVARFAEARVSASPALRVVSCRPRGSAPLAFHALLEWLVAAGVVLVVAGAALVGLGAVARGLAASLSSPERQATDASGR